MLRKHSKERTGGLKVRTKVRTGTERMMGLTISMARAGLGQGTVMIDNYLACVHIFAN